MEQQLSFLLLFSYIHIAGMQHFPIVQTESKRVVQKIVAESPRENENENLNEPLKESALV